jgi:putative aldouronate transport system substrate-binding protein
MQFMNLMFKSEEIINLLHNGIEGVHYVKTDNPGIIRYPDGLDVTTTGYNNPLGLYGDKSKKYVWEPASPTYFDDLRAFNATIDDSVASQALGYCFNSDPVKTEFAAVTDVINQYQTTLNSGSVDPSVVLPEFISALEAAGKDRIIEENQRQLDEWLANK